MNIATVFLCCRMQGPFLLLLLIGAASLLTPCGGFGNRRLCGIQLVEALLFVCGEKGLFYQPGRRLRQDNIRVTRGVQTGLYQLKGLPVPIPPTKWMYTRPKAYQWSSHLVDGYHPIGLPSHHRSASLQAGVMMKDGALLPQEIKEVMQKGPSAGSRMKKRGIVEQCCHFYCDYYDLENYCNI
ncbi:hypothetical protein NFI96_024589 [Prochilodus magdalenae]|nr:hypothetical protein NFI96_024589 [Prochilodus magdalenae]